MEGGGGGKRKSRGITSFYGNATGDCTNAIGSRRTRNGVRRAIESFHGGGGRRKNFPSGRRNLSRRSKTFQALLQIAIGEFCGEQRGRRGVKKKKDHAGSSRGVKQKKISNDRERRACVRRSCFLTENGISCSFFLVLLISLINS